MAGQAKGGQRIQKAGSQASQAAVAEAGVVFGVCQFGVVDTEFSKGVSPDIADAEMAAMTAAGDCARFPIEE